jgi:hypothetical protein
MCFGRKSVGPESKKNEDIEKNLRADKKRAEREVKLLLLGMHHPPASAPSAPKAPLTKTQHRCRRERQVDSPQADAHHQRRRLWKP